MLAGYLSSEKNQLFFKMVHSKAIGENIDIKKSGSVCSKTATITVGKMKEMLTRMDSVCTYNHKKDQLCTLYEISLRTHAPRLILRPYLVHEILKNNKKK